MFSPGSGAARTRASTKGRSSSRRCSRSCRRRSLWRQGSGPSHRSQSSSGGGSRSGTYIDVGANHPVDNNVTFLFYERGWHGTGKMADGSPLAIDLSKTADGLEARYSFGGKPFGTETYARAK